MLHAALYLTGACAAYAVAVNRNAGGVANHLALAVFFSIALISALSQAARYLSSLLRFRSLVWLGRRSYPIYLFHFGILGIGFELNDRGIYIEDRAGVLIALIALVATLALSEVAHRWIEKPAISLGRKLAAQVSKPDHGLAAHA